MKSGTIGNNFIIIIIINTIKMMLMNVEDNYNYDRTWA